MTDAYKIRVPIQIRYSDFDMLRHLNNAAYATYLEIARLHYLKKIFKENSVRWLDVVASLTLNFRKPILPEHRPLVLIKCSRIGNSSYDLDYLIVDEEDNENIYAEGKTVQVFIDEQKNTTIPIPDRAREVLNNF